MSAGTRWSERLTRKVVDFHLHQIRGSGVPRVDGSPASHCELLARIRLIVGGRQANRPDFITVVYGWSQPQDGYIIREWIFPVVLGKGNHSRRSDHCRVRIVQRVGPDVNNDRAWRNFSPSFVIHTMSSGQHVLFVQQSAAALWGRKALEHPGKVQFSLASNTSHRTHLRFTIHGYLCGGTFVPR